MTSGPDLLAADVMRPIRLAFDRLDAAGVSWAVVRGGVGTADAGRDVDVLVGSGELDRCGDVLRDAGWIPVPGWTRGPRRSWLGFDAEGPRWPLVDLADRLEFGRSPIRFDAAACLGRATIDGVRRLAPADGWWVSCLHTFLDGTEPPGASTLEALRRQAVEVAPGTAPLAPGRFRGDVPWDPDHIVDAARAARWHEVAAALRALDSAGSVGPRTARRLLGTAVGRATRRIARTVRRAPRIAVVGADPGQARAIVAAVSAGLSPALRSRVRSSIDGPRADLTIRLEACGPVGSHQPANATTTFIDPGQPEGAVRAAVASEIWQAIGRRWR